MIDHYSLMPGYRSLIIDFAESWGILLKASASKCLHFLPTRLSSLDSILSSQLIPSSRRGNGLRMNYSRYNLGA
jgi:hypothetical protein